MIDTAITHTIARTGQAPGLATRLRLADGRIHEGAITAERHRRIHLGLLHAVSGPAHSLAFAFGTTLTAPT